MNDFNLRLDYSIASIYSFAFQQNQYPLVSSLSLSAENNETIPQDIQVQLNSDPEVIICEPWRLTHLDNGASSVLNAKTVRISPDYLNGLTENLDVSLTFKIYIQDQLVDEVAETVTLLPKNQWAGFNNMPELLGAFSTPNSPYVEEIIRSTTETLAASQLSSTIDGYQSRTREKPYQMLSALWNVIKSKKIGYVNPSPSFATSGQRVRLAEDIKNMPNAACLDLAMLFSSAIERMGLNPVVCVTKQHAFVGAWLIDASSQFITNDDPMDLRKKVASQDLVLFETTLAVMGSRATFAQAIEAAERLISEDKEDEFVFALDITQARKQKIKPLPTLEKFDVPEAEADVGIEAVPIAPPLPPVKIEDIPSDDQTPETRVDTWKRKLLDLTKRNRLLNLSSNAVALKIFCPDLPLLEDKLASGETFNVIATDETPFSQEQRDQQLFKFETGSDSQVDFAKEQLRSNVIISNENRSRTDKQLLSLFRKTKNDLEEGGSNTLFLSIGMLKWKETSDSSKSYRAPLVLLPVELIRQSARSKIKIKQIKDEEPVFNSTLIQLLQQDFEINLNQFRDELPQDDSGIDVQKIWTIVRQKIDDSPGFEVTEELVLSNFSFAKYLMWKDLQDRVSDLKENPFVEHMIERPTDAYLQDLNFIDQSEVDDRIKPSEVFAPLNADTSQLIAIAASGHPQDFVLEGPPGTGKSETIANIICHNIALGKKVLFVAEKMAALNVVYKRLNKVGLGHLCLELHSNKSSKSAMLDQLREAWTKREEADQSEWLREAEDLFELRSKLNHYIDELHAKRHFNISAREAIARSSRYKDLHLKNVSWGPSLTEAPISNSEELDQMYVDLGKLSIAFGDVVNFSTKDFEFIEHSDWSNEWQSKTVDSARILLSDLRAMTVLAHKLIALLGLETTKKLTLSGLLSAENFCDFINEIKDKKNSLIFSGKSKQLFAELKQLKEFKVEYDKYLNLASFKPDEHQIASLPWKQWKEEYVSVKQKSFIGSFFGKRRLKKLIKDAGIVTFNDFEDLVTIANAKATVEKVTFDLNDFTASKVWSGWDMSLADLSNNLEFFERNVGRVNTFIQSLYLNVVDCLPKFKNIFDDEWDFIEHNNPLMELLAEFSSRKGKLVASLRNFEELSKHSTASSKESDELERLLDNLINNAPKLSAWCRWLDAKKIVGKYQISEIISGLEHEEFPREELVEVTRTALMRWLAPKLIDENETLRTFSGSQHNQLIDDFRQLDKHVAETTSKFIVASTASRVPNPGSREQAPEYGVLSRELQKKSRHMPVRKLIEEMGGSLLDLTPCMLMSPLSVAQYLPANFNAFDLIVFDEASQITVWDAVGAIARAKNVIVVGDPKQMPPTNFFGRSGSDDEDEADLESILDQALGSGIKHHRLTGHYRSRHETLIAFSNSHYYQNSLVTFPSAETKKSAVSFHKVNGVYAKGKGRNNPIEAAAVAKEVLRRLQDTKLCNLSIGIVTLNTEQARTIEDELDTIRRNNPEIEKFFQGGAEIDPVFVKNLESVQGDERDIIIFSVGYGPTEPGSNNISMNFGPLNKQGGERRLNVAITRATTEVLLFASFGAELIDLSRTQATAVQHLKTFFEFAEKGPIALAEAAETNFGVDTFDSDFELAVAFKLRELGWTVQTQIGVGKFRIDLGITHPDRPGVFLAGIECDGATYHSSPSARDRDRVRQIILEGLGWNIIRLWSTDYFLDPETSIIRIDEKLRQLLEEGLAEDEKIDTPATEIATEDLENSLTKESFYDIQSTKSLRLLCEKILAEKSGISLFALNNEIAKKLGIGRVTERFKERVLHVLLPWAGISEVPKNNPTIWYTKEEVTDFISWRGIAPFGFTRSWQEISFHEQLGVAEQALKTNNVEPEIAMKEMFQLKRLTETTKNEFLKWVDNYRKYWNSQF